MKRRTLLKTWSLSALALIQTAHAATKTIASSCAAPTGTATPFYRASELAMGGLQSHWLPRAHAFAQTASALQQTLQTTPADLPAQRAAWVRCMLAWEQLAAVPAGALLERRSVRTLDFWPTRTAQVQALAQVAKDASAEVLAARVRAAGVGAKGLPALEWLLWPQATQPGAQALAAAISSEVSAEAGTLLQAYQTATQAPDSGSVDEAQAWTDYGEWFTQCMGSLDQLRLKKMRVNTRGKDSTIWVRGLSGQTAAAWQAQWESIANFLAGDPAGNCAPSNDAAARCFTDLLRSRGHLAPATQLAQQLATTRLAVHAARPQAPSSVLRAQNSIAALHTLASDMGARLFDFSQGFTDADGD
ncbi:imelysin family protein [Rhodoferax sp. TBRC 17198]|uniref:imelysin family protein n=1 Tax=Rhodoferax potami TaxID=3068338 RepID=UPI0028BDE8C2|nr:imelysin family protein [Rhodoferax sp. TBRC 17198]MDT7521753.1 imelysin family protein [Rhodoferax sp. TBRC 17198]